jgi:hypothetical protein
MSCKKAKIESSSKQRKRKSEKKPTSSQTKKKQNVSIVSLTSSIFGDQSNGESLSSSIFGTNSSSSQAQDDLFGSSDRWQKVSENRVKKNTDSMLATCEEDTPILSKAEIMKARTNRSKSKDAIDLTDSITVHVPEMNNMEHVKDEEKDEVCRSMNKIFTIQCDTLMRENGVVIIKSNDRMIAKNHMKSLTSQAGVIEDQICSRLKEKGNIFHVSEGSTSIDSCISEKNRKMEQNHSFQYNEVASRCLGRLDIRYKMNEPPFSEDEVVSNKFIKPVVHSLLGKDAKLVYAGLILSFPLSADQPFHQDGTALFEDNEFPIHQKLPPYALNVFIPLDDVTEELGPTEFCVGSHYREEAIKVMKYLESGDEKSAKVIAPLLKTGDALIYDYRVCHRGTQNLAEKTRPMLYLMYSRPWFSEFINFSDEKLFC